MNPPPRPLALTRIPARTSFWKSLARKSRGKSVPATRSSSNTCPSDPRAASSLRPRIAYSVGLENIKRRCLLAHRINTPVKALQANVPSSESAAAHRVQRRRERISREEADVAHLPQRGRGIDVAGVSGGVHRAENGF